MQQNTEGRQNMNLKRKLESEKPAQKVNIKCTVVGEPADFP